MVVDDCFLKVGSSNLNNRSMGFDTECDISVEVTRDTPDADTAKRAILQLRHDLLAEHLDRDIATVAQAVADADGSLIAAIEHMRSDGKTLLPLDETDAQTNGDSVWAENAFLDPERTQARWKGIRRMAKRIRKIIGLA